MNIDEHRLSFVGGARVGIMYAFAYLDIEDEQLLKQIQSHILTVTLGGKYDEQIEHAIEQLNKKMTH